MLSLETRIPPPIVAALVGVLMWWKASSLSTPGESPLGVAFAALFLAIGLSIAVAAWIEFQRAKTTANPIDPSAASTLVDSGVFRFSRNPMYVGLTTVLVAWACYLGALIVALGPIAFAFYVTRFQIVPEERALRAKFGDAFAAYEKRAPRWL